MRMSDCRSDVCSSDLLVAGMAGGGHGHECLGGFLAVTFLSKPCHFQRRLLIGGRARFKACPVGPNRIESTRTFGLGAVREKGRTSIVEGKRVLVLVYLGSTQLSKIKYKTNYKI